ncbi:MAG TPA: EF-P lysine aminoacylase EpmA [Azospirillaceae bacterium]|nr:EF-P lysine aminoacylase EpmA [Azospirillaceae bacterium]
MTLPALPRLPWWHPEAFARRRPHLEGRARVLAALRRVFADEGFVEVETPALQISPGLEVHLMAFATEFQALGAEERQRLYLHTSPEFAMKKLLVAGVERLYQIAHVYRNGERTAVHHPEFTMLEWYRAGAGYHDLMRDCTALVRAACEATGKQSFSFRGMACDPFADWRVLTVADAFRDYAGIDLLATAPDPACPDTALLAQAAGRAGITPHDGDTWEDLFFRILLERIEPHLGEGVPTFLTDYPVSMACLARPRPDDPRVAERFELYACGLELANAFGELTDAAAQRARFEADMAAKERLYGTRYPIDEDFLAALDHGLPDSAGIALGLDRLVMLCTGAERIDQVLWAPVAE